MLQDFGFSEFPVFLAPLAGVSDYPFRLICAEQGAELTYVEMLNATALNYRSRRTLEMLKTHPDERTVGVQVTGKTPDELQRAIDYIHPLPFHSIDINMGCPVRKVVKTGCGSAILKDPQRVFDTVKAAREATDKPISVKIRIGWDHNSINSCEVGQAAQEAGAAWLTVHGRTRSDDYSAPVRLNEMGILKARLSIPVLGNGNIFSQFDRDLMAKRTEVDGVMVSRGALGNPWVFREISQKIDKVTVDEWESVVTRHLALQKQAYGLKNMAAVCMRKHLLWYAKGWPGGKKYREAMNSLENLDDAVGLIRRFADHLRKTGVTSRHTSTEGAATQSKFDWDPKWEMDRKNDRGVGDDPGC